MTVLVVFLQFFNGNNGSTSGNLQLSIDFNVGTQLYLHVTINLLLKSSTMTKYRSFSNLYHIGALAHSKIQHQGTTT
jgi:hypothetical protein